MSIQRARMHDGVLVKVHGTVQLEPWLHRFDTLYRLCAVAVHDGVSAQGGHYRAYGLRTANVSTCRCAVLCWVTPAFC